MEYRTQKWPFWLFGVWFVLTTIYLKVYIHARGEFRIAETHLKRGKMLPAIRSYGLTVRWYTPGNRYVRVAIRRLLQIGGHAYQRGDWEQAITAYQHLRNALASLRGLYQPHHKAFDRCQLRLAEVLSHLPPSSRTKTVPRAIRQKKIHKLLTKHELPAPWVSFFVVLGYACWLLCAGLLCMRWMEFSNMARLYWGFGAFTSFCAWFFVLVFG